MPQSPMQATKVIERRGLMLVLSSPSGAGKTTLTRMLLQERALDLSLSISVTTRARRVSEAEGVHYHFIDTTTFEVMRAKGELLESAQVHSNFYGTPRKPVDAVLAQGRDVLFDIDYQGTQQLREHAESDVVTIFILPPSMAELHARLQRRAEDKPEIIETRLTNARKEMLRWRVYDYVLVNDDLDRTFKQVQAILVAERLKVRRTRDHIAHIVDGLLAER